MRKAAQPGFISNIERTSKAINGEVSPSGRTYNKKDEAAAWFGFRFSTLDPKVSLYYRSFEFKDDTVDAGKHVTDVIRSRDDISDAQMVNALKTSNRLKAKAFKEMSLIITAAMKTGTSKGEVVETLKNSGISERSIHALLKGETMNWRPSKQQERNLVKKAKVTFGREGAKRTHERYKRLAKLARESGN